MLSSYWLVHCTPLLATGGSKLGETSDQKYIRYELELILHVLGELVNAFARNLLGDFHGYIF